MIVEFRKNNDPKRGVAYVNAGQVSSVEGLTDGTASTIYFANGREIVVVGSPDEVARQIRERLTVHLAGD